MLNAVPCPYSVTQVRVLLLLQKERKVGSENIFLRGKETFAVKRRSAFLTFQLHKSGLSSLELNAALVLNLIYEATLPIGGD